MFSNALEHIIITFCHDMHFVLHLIARYLFRSRICFLSVDPETAVDPEYDYDRRRSDPCSRASRQANPLDHSDIAHSFSLLSCIRYCYSCCSVAPILMHSLMLSPVVDTLPVILSCLV